MPSEGTERPPELYLVCRLTLAFQRRVHYVESSGLSAAELLRLRARLAKSEFCEWEFPFRR
jgi:hypothetical protein